MEGTPAGWYDDPEQPGQQRWWDGNGWTDQRAPAGAAPAAAAGSVPPVDPAAPPTGSAPTMPPPGAPAPPGAVPPPPGAPAKSSRKGLWIALIVVGVVFVGIIAAIAAVAFLGGDSATDVVEKNLPAALEDNYRAQGLDVTVSKTDCASISNDEGPFTSKCTITIAGLAEPLEATIYGNIDGNKVSVDDATSDQTILDADLAAKQAQPSIDAIDPTVNITSCTLSAPVVIVTDGMTFTCDTDSNETVTFTVENGGLEITNVS